MRSVIDAFWRAAAYCLHPRVIALSVLPLVIASVLGVGLAWLYWEDAINGVRDALEQWPVLAPAVAWLNEMTGGVFRSVIGPLVVVTVAVPVLLVISLLLVGALMGPAIVRLVAARRFPALERRHGTPWWSAALMSLGAAVLALLLLVLTAPLWLIPPMPLLLPPLIWGWLAYRVLGTDALSDHADANERRALMAAHRARLFGMGIVTGYLGAAPSMVWALGAMVLPMAPLLVPVFVWLYTLVFAFAALWFTHYCLAALQVQRTAAATGQAVVDVEAQLLPEPDEPAAIDAGGLPPAGDGPAAPPQLPPPGATTGT